MLNNKKQDIITYEEGGAKIKFAYKKGDHVRHSTLGLTGTIKKVEVFSGPSIFYTINVDFDENKSRPISSFETTACRLVKE